MRSFFLDTRMGAAFGAILFTTLVMIVWYLVVRYQLVNPIFVADPLAAITVLVENAREGVLWTSIGETSRRMIFGWAAASIVGIALGALIGSSRLAQELLLPTLEVFRPLPASAVIPVAILIFGLTDEMAVAVIMFGALWPVLLSTIHGFCHVPQQLREVGDMLEMGQVKYFFTISLPSALLDIMPGIRISLAISLILAVVTEMQASLGGVGHDIFIAQRTFRTAELYAGLLVIGLIGLTINQALLVVERRLFAWSEE